MTAHNSLWLALLAASSPIALASAPARAQTEPPAPPPTTQQQASLDDEQDEENAFLDEGDGAIVVTAARERGAAVGDIKPLEQYDAGDIRALGVSSINDLLTELGPQVQSASGRPPVMLLEGRRMSSPREIASLPSEAIQRVDVLPEEVGLRYGYGADQKVINFVLRERFRAVTVELDGRMPTAGGAANLEGELGFLSIRNGRRLNLGAEVEGQQSLYESERGLDGPDSAYRTLVSGSQKLTLNGTYYMPLADRLGASVNGELVTEQTDSAIGRAVPFGLEPYMGPSAGNVGALERNANRLSGHLGFSVARDHASGQISLTGNYDHSYSRTISDRPFNLLDYADAVAAGDPSALASNDPTAQFLVTPAADVARSYTDTATLDLLYNSSLATLPAGDVSLTAHLSGSTSTFRSTRTRDLVATPSRVRRDVGGGSVNLSIPIAGRGTPLSDTIGNLSLNLNGGLDRMSDAGSVHSYGMGFNWQPMRILSFTGNFTNKQTAPTPQQLGDAAITTFNVPVFDYLRGETVDVITISGGNPNLDKAEVQSFRIGMAMSPLKDPQLNLTVDLSQNRTTGGITAMPGVTLATQTAFADRFVRAALDPNDPDDASQTVGRLTQIDMRPINIGRQKSTQIRWGVNFTKQLKTPQREIEAFQEVGRRRIQEGIASGRIPPEVAARFGQGQGQGQNSAAQGAQNQATPQAAGQQPQSGDTPAAQGQSGQAVVVTGNRPEQGGPPPGAPFSGGPRGPGGPGAFRGPPGGFGGFGGNRGGNQRGGRINAAFYHTWVLDSTTQLAPTLPVIDQLNGGTLGGGAGPSRHQLQLQGGYTQSGIGFRMFANWKSATRSVGSSGSAASDLRFASLATVNLRLFMNFQQQPKLVEKVPFLRGARLTVGVNNLFDARQKVTDATGATPYAYQAAFLDRTGRTVSIGFRKLF